MKLKMNPFFTAASGKLDPSHDDVNQVYVLHDKVFSRRVCNPRKLEKNPYSEKEKAQQTKFKAAIQSVNNTLADVDLRAAAEAKFRAQTKYKSLRGYLMAEYMKNN